jgi:hypothetical protein
MNFQVGKFQYINIGSVSINVGFKVTYFKEDNYCD